VRRCAVHGGEGGVMRSEPVACLRSHLVCTVRNGRMFEDGVSKIDGFERISQGSMNLGTFCVSRRIFRFY